ncbi:MAG TPA: ethanolamine ammonia-lyase subunit EutC [Chroococcales cyanobacterium]
MPKFVIKPEENTALNQMKESTPARVAVGRAGARPATEAWLQFRADHALARDAVRNDFNQQFMDFAAAQNLPVIQSQARDRSDFIAFPPKGKHVDEQTCQWLKLNCPINKDVQIVISDGLSARAIEDNIDNVLPMLLGGLEQEDISYGTPVVVRYGRVAVADQITHLLGAKLAIMLIGERPGLSAADSMSAYLTYGAGPNTISSDRTVVSNIHSRGTLPVEAGAYIVQIAKRILSLKVSGVKLQKQS